MDEVRDEVRYNNSTGSMEALEELLSRKSMNRLVP